MAEETINVTMRFSKDLIDEVEKVFREQMPEGVAFARTDAIQWLVRRGLEVARKRK